MSDGEMVRLDLAAPVWDRVITVAPRRDGVGHTPGPESLPAAPAGSVDGRDTLREFPLLADLRPGCRAGADESRSLLFPAGREP